MIITKITGVIYSNLDTVSNRYFGAIAFVNSTVIHLTHFTRVTITKLTVYSRYVTTCMLRPTHGTYRIRVGAFVSILEYHLYT
jgi:hypothetical protein